MFAGYARTLATQREVDNVTLVKEAVHGELALHPAGRLVAAEPPLIDVIASDAPIS